MRIALKPDSCVQTSCSVNRSTPSHTMGVRSVLSEALCEAALGALTTAVAVPILILMTIFEGLVLLPFSRDDPIPSLPATIESAGSDRELKPPVMKV